MTRFLGLVLCLGCSSSLSLAVSPSPTNCALCDVVLTAAAKFGGNETSIAQAIAHLSQDCDKLFGDGGKKVNGTLDTLCKDLAEAAVDVFPFGDKQIGTLAWDARAGCAALGACSVPCCEGLLPTAPQQVHIALTRSASEMAVSWTTLNATASHTVQWGRTPLCDLGESVDGRSDTYVDFGWIGVLHTATMTGLAPGERYYYRVGDATGGWGRVWSFKTLPAAAGTDDSPLRMASIGDMGYANNSDGTIAQLEALVDSGGIDLVLHNGDVSYADGDMRHWDVFMRKIERVAARVPYMTTPGNHEFWFNFTAYKKRFAMPVVGGHHANGYEDAMYWSLDVGGGALHLVGMNTESVIDKAAMSEAQVVWLRADLAAARERRALRNGDVGAGASVAGFTVAFGHRPFYCSNPGPADIRNGQALLRRKAEDILNEGGVDLVLQAHVHDYERTLPVRNGAPTATNYTSPAAPVYVVNGAAGNREANARAPGNESWSPAADPAAGAVPLMHDISYGVVTVASTSLRFQQFFAANGTAFDTFTITKPAQRRMLEL